MSLARLLRTARHLSAEQIFCYIVRGIRHAHWQRRPDAARSRIAAAASRLEPPDPHRPAISRIADIVLGLQRAIHTEPASELRAGRLRIYGRAVEMSGPRGIVWRDDDGEGNSPLRRLTLAYFGWAVPLLTEGGAGDVGRIADAIASLDAEPWSSPGIFRDLWNPYTTSHRLINLLSGLNLYRRAGGMPSDSSVHVILDHVRRCAAFIEQDLERDIQANHLFKNSTALATYAAATPAANSQFPDLSRLIRYSLDQLVLDDGVHAERSPMYHALGLMDVEIVLASGAAPGLDARLREAATMMRRALGILTHPDGEIALFNDAWLGGAPPPAVLGAAPPGAGCHHLPTGGYTRLAGGKAVAIFDCGPSALDCQPGHAHADFLSFELSLGGQRLIVDPGTSTYTAGALRDQTRSAASHNGPHLLGHEPIEFWGSFRVGRRGTAGMLTDPALGHLAPLWCAGWQDGYRDLGKVYRWIGLWPDRAMLVLDLWPASDLARCRSRFLVPHRWNLRRSAKALHLTGPAKVSMQALAGELDEPHPAVWWPRYGEEESAIGFEIHPKRHGTRSIAALALCWSTEPKLPTLAAIEELAARLTVERT